MARHDVRVVRSPPIEAGWSGKLWAQHYGIGVAASEASEYYWLTDADILHAPYLLRSIIFEMTHNDLDFHSLMAYLSIRRLWERFMTPAFIYFFQLLYPFRGVNDPYSSVAGGAGGCIVLKSACLRAAGGLSSIRNSLIDDCALGRRIKEGGGRIRLLLAHKHECWSMRYYDRFSDFWYMVVRSA